MFRYIHPTHIYKSNESKLTGLKIPLPLPVHTLHEKLWQKMILRLIHLSVLAWNSEGVLHQLNCSQSLRIVIFETSPRHSKAS